MCFTHFVKSCRDRKRAGEVRNGEVMVVGTDRIFLSVCVDRVGLDIVISVPRHVRFWIRLSLEVAVQLQLVS